jgi:hypothetical protein
VRSALAAVIAAASVAMLAGCGGNDTPMPPRTSAAASAEIVKKDCADPKWKEQNLGLWYSVCRTPMRW